MCAMLTEAHVIFDQSALCAHSGTRRSTVRDQRSSSPTAAAAPRAGTSRPERTTSGDANILGAGYRNRACTLTPSVKTVSARQGRSVTRKVTHARSWPPSRGVVWSRAPVPLSPCCWCVKPVRSVFLSVSPAMQNENYKGLGTPLPMRAESSVTCHGCTRSWRRWCFPVGSRSIESSHCPKAQGCADCARDETMPVEERAGGRTALHGCTV
jgi:hypothetical protein